jgi:hypothetical protein
VQDHARHVRVRVAEGFRRLPIVAAVPTAIRMPFPATASPSFPVTVTVANWPAGGPGSGQQNPPPLLPGTSTVMWQSWIWSRE